VIEKIGALNRDSDDEFKKYLLQLVARSAWTGFRGAVFLNELIRDLNRLLVDPTRTVQITFIDPDLKKWTKCAVDSIDALLTDPKQTWLTSDNPLINLGSAIYSIIRIHQGSHISAKSLCGGG
jgi:hypothetical protein